MCGIVGILSFKKPVERQTLKAATDALAHRGPDGEGFWVSAHQNAGLGHRRLSIVDLHSGQQPLISTDGQKALVVNGELYGYKAIRADLEKNGYVFKTKSDSEIILPLYEKYGTDCLRFLRGEFAFILWDEKEQRLFCARDRFGIKPLCYAETADGILLASEAKALFALGVPAAWDEYAFFHSASLQYTPQDRTLFKDIRQLKPGHAMIADKNGIKIFKYWDLDYPPDAAINDVTDEGQTIEAFRHVFEESVRLRLEADVPACFHLSGGLDSSAVLGYATRHMPGKADAFTVSFDHADYDESTVAEETARHLDAKLHIVRVTQDDIVREMPRAVLHGEGLAINGHLTAKYLLNKAIRDAGFKVALTGEGADEALAGYPHLRLDLFRSENAGADMAAQVLATNPVSAGVQLAHGDGLSTQAVADKLGYVPAFLQAKASMGLRMHGILSQDFRSRLSGTDCYADLMAAAPVREQLSGRHVVNQSSWLWTKTALANYILRTLGDGMEMAQSVEGRVPFLDHVLFDFCRRLPMHMKIKGATEKYILREAARPYITPTVYKKQKHPFMAPPVSRFSDTGMMSMIRDTVNSTSFASMPFFDRAAVLKMIDGFDKTDEKERTAAEPVLMMVMTAGLLHDGFKMRSA